ncbi:TP901 family phage tail tape measure protein [Pseudomonas sp. SJZ085]|uniref:phage tail tape measure protein n=1 Tax=unclassified Pseudomonas TaxID=196821 RepID=UPI00119C2266|nr:MULTISPECIES: phage tail tape measure protein [unclassified Pseudomonas]TWC19292.1 TP901 family phage tail tape measure protein [Pseudomonas sp. SJZ074]TWC37082.1 TP901 family phage tail tape measure protein [Pseudomonas sp. SJZ085]
MADTQKVEKRAVLLTGIDELSPKLAGLRAKVQGFKQNLDATGLGSLDISGLLPDGGIAKPFMEGLRSATALKSEVAEVNGVTSALQAPEAPRVAAQSLDGLKTSISNVSVQFGSALGPAVSAVAIGLQPMVNGMTQVLQDNPQLVQGLAAGAVAFSAMQTAVSGASQALEVVSLALKMNPIGLIAMGIALAAGMIIAYWEPISAFFAGLWQRLAPIVMPMAEFFKTMFAWSPLGLIVSNWTPLTGLFSAIWDLLRALTVPVMDALQGLFNWTPLSLIMANWGSLVDVFAGIWEGLHNQVSIMLAVFAGLFDWSPIDGLTKQWGPVSEWFSQWWDELQGVIAPIKAFFNGGFGEVITTFTGKVQGLTEAQQKTNAEGKGELAPALFGSAGALPQTSSALVQQSAANSRTQLEGGLTVRFENAPAGLRAEPAQTNQPGLAVSSRIGYRSLSAGGSNELA